jgi:hypothetical protein
VDAVAHRYADGDGGTHCNIDVCPHDDPYRAADCDTYGGDHAYADPTRNTYSPAHAYPAADVDAYDHLDTRAAVCAGRARETL